MPAHAGPAHAVLVLAALGAFPAAAHAQPAAATVTGCAFDAAALERALVVEQQGRPPPPPIAVTCAGDTATITLRHPDRPPTTRTVDLADVPAPLAPRVVALVAVAAAHEPPAETGGPQRSEPSVAERAGSSPPKAGTAPATGADPPRATDTPRDDRAVPSRPSLRRDGLGELRPTGVAARGLARIHDGTTTLWGAGAAVMLGPASIGVTAAGTRVEHTLGTLTPWLAAADAGLTVACAGAACVSVRGELGRVWVAADATDPMMVATHPLAATYLHGAAELSLDARLGGVEVAATAAVGASRGVIARAGDEAAAVLAGWTFTGAIEVRR